MQVTEDSFQDILDLSNSSYSHGFGSNGLGNNGSSADHEHFLALSRAFKLDASSLLLAQPNDEQSSPSLLPNSSNFVGAAPPASFGSQLPHPRNKTCLLSSAATPSSGGLPLSANEPLFPSLGTSLAAAAAAAAAEQHLQLNSIGNGRTTAAVAAAAAAAAAAVAQQQQHKQLPPLNLHHANQPSSLPSSAASTPSPASSGSSGSSPSTTSVLASAGDNGDILGNQG